MAILTFVTFRAHKIVKKKTNIEKCFRAEARQETSHAAGLVSPLMLSELSSETVNSKDYEYNR